MTKFGAAARGFTVFSPGTVLVIQKAGILGVPPANVTMGTAIFIETASCISPPPATA